jgi:serine/threonine protein kinase
MEYVEGISLRDLIQKHRDAGTRVPLPAVIDMGAQIAAGLAAAHAAGIVHRDIKPENVMLRPDGLAKVLDFGLAKLARQPTTSRASQSVRSVDTEPGMVIGTVQYMSPEQARGLPIDRRTDVWSLGAVLYELVSGTAPFTGETSSDIIVAVLDREPRPLTAISPTVPRDLERLILKALAKDRNGRHESMTELAGDLKNIQLAFPENESRGLSPSRSPLLVYLGTALVAASLIGVAIFLAREPQVNPARQVQARIEPQSPPSAIFPSRDSAAVNEKKATQVEPKPEVTSRLDAPRPAQPVRNAEADGAKVQALMDGLSSGLLHGDVDNLRRYYLVPNDAELSRIATLVKRFPPPRLTLNSSPTVVVNNANLATGELEIQLESAETVQRLTIHC